MSTHATAATEARPPSPEHEHEIDALLDAERRQRNAWWDAQGFITSSAAAEAEGVNETTIEMRHRRGHSTWVRIGRELVTSKEEYRRELLSQLDQRRADLLAAREAKAVPPRRAPALL